MTEHDFPPLAPILSATGLACKVGKFQLGPLDLAVPEGSITALIGPNGAGKTTLMDLLYGLGRPTSGQILVAGMSLPQDDLGVKRRVGFVSPDLSYVSWGKVGAALEFVSGFYPDWREDEAQRLRATRTIEVMLASMIVAVPMGFIAMMNADTAHGGQMLMRWANMLIGISVLGLVAGFALSCYLLNSSRRPYRPWPIANNRWRGAPAG